MKLFTIGFTRKSAEQFFTTLRDSGASRVLDVRQHNTSQLAAFAKAGKDHSGGDLGFFLRELCEMDYRHLPQLCPDTALLRAYRNHLLSWSEYSERYLLQIAHDHVHATFEQSLLDNSVLLCSEHAPDRCHRRLAALFLRERWGDVEIIHL